MSSLYAWITNTRQSVDASNAPTWSSPMTKYLDIDELAALLGQRADTIRKKLRVSPYALPPKMHIPGSRMLRWRAHEVKIWLQEHGQLESRRSFFSNFALPLVLLEALELAFDTHPYVYRSIVTLVRPSPKSYVAIRKSEYRDSPSP